MAVATHKRKLLGVRVTPQQERELSAAARREQRSVSSFVLEAALQRAADQPKRRRTHEEILALLKPIREEFNRRVSPDRDVLEEFLTERRAEAKRE